MHTVRHQVSMLWALAALFAATGSLLAQDDGPVSFPELKKDDIKVEVLEYPVDLPKGEVARIGDRVLTVGDLLKQLLRVNLNSIADNLLNTKMVELELQREGITITPEECEEELKEILPRLAPGKSLEEVVTSGVYSRGYLMRMAMINRGWKVLFWRAKNIPEDQRSSQASQLLIQIYMGEIKAKYSLGIRGQNPAPPKGAIASLDTLINGKRVSYVVTPIEAMEFMVGILRPASIISGQKALIDNQLVEDAMRAAGVNVTDTEVEAWVRAMNEKYPAPFNWPTILRLKGTTPDEERERWRHVQAWRRCNKIDDVSGETLDVFIKQHEDFFRGRHVKVAHILLKFIDDVTGLSKGPAAEKEAEEKAQRIYQLAMEGTEFKTLAERFSEDEQTAKGGGAFTQPIKKWGGGYDPAFQAAAYGLNKAGEISKPVKSAMGWHVIQCTEVNRATDRAMDWKDPRYAEWILEEYETAMMKQWREAIAAKSNVKLVSAEELLRLKTEAFPKKGE